MRNSPITRLLPTWEGIEVRDEASTPGHGVRLSSASGRVSVPDQVSVPD